MSDPAKPVGPYTPIVRAGDWLVVSGQVGSPTAASSRRGAGRAAPGHRQPRGPPRQPGCVAVGRGQDHRLPAPHERLYADERLLHGRASATTARPARPSASPSSPSVRWSKWRRGPGSGDDGPMVGGILIALVLVVVIPVAVMMSGTLVGQRAVGRSRRTPRSGTRAASSSPSTGSARSGRRAHGQDCASLWQGTDEYRA